MDVIAPLLLPFFLKERINEQYNFNVSLLPPQLVCAIVLSNCMVLLLSVLKYLICGTKESL